MPRPDPVTYKFRFGEAGVGWGEGFTHKQHEDCKEELRNTIQEMFGGVSLKMTLEKPARVDHQDVIAEWMTEFGQEKYFVDLNSEKECCYWVDGKWYSCAEAPLLVRTKENVVKPWMIKVQPEGMQEVQIPMYVWVEWLCEEF